MNSFDPMEELTRLQLEKGQVMSRMAELFSLQGEESVLVCLGEERGAVFVGDIRKRLGLSSGRTAIILGRLEEKGLIVRRKDKKDGRRISVELTDEGRLRSLDLLERLGALHRTLAEKLGERDTAEYIRLVKRILELSEELTDTNLGGTYENT